MLNGKPALFISCSEKHKERVAYPFRDLIQASNMLPIIVSDAPKLVGTWTPDEKVEAYLDRADILIALCTPDNELMDGSWEVRLNIIDELARARNKPYLRDRICVFKEMSVRLPSNMNPTYDRLNLGNLDPAFVALLAQLRTWGFEVPESSKGIRTTYSSECVPDIEIIQGLRPDDLNLTQDRVRQCFRIMNKAEQRNYVSRVLDVIRLSPQWENRAIAGHLLEGVVEIDPKLVTVDMLDELSRHSDFSVRSSAAIILFALACMSPGMVPIDIAARLARPTKEDWYVYTPALSALKQLTLSRPEAIAALVSLAESSNRDDREYAVAAFKSVAKIKPAVVPNAAVARLAIDTDPVIREIARETQSLLRNVSESEQRHPYSPFTPF